MATDMQEYLVKLGVSLDTENMAKLQNFLKSGKVQAAMFSAALVAAGKAIYNFIRDNTAFEESLVRTAREEDRFIKNARASENALKAMGKTLQEVQRDATLTKMYNDLVKINEAMEFPDMINKMRSHSGQIGFEVPQNSPSDLFLRKLVAYLDTATADRFALGSISIVDNASGIQYACTGVTPQKRPDRQYDQTAGNLTYGFLVAEITEV